MVWYVNYVSIKLLKIRRQGVYHLFNTVLLILGSVIKQEWREREKDGWREGGRAGRRDKGMEGWTDEGVRLEKETALTIPT